MRTVKLPKIKFIYTKETYQGENKKILENVYYYLFNIAWKNIIKKEAK